jgi:hypothetical protein
MTQGPNRTVPAPEPRGATLHLTLDAAEHQRRTESAASPILDPASLDLLLALPVGIPVAVGALSWSQQQAVRRLPRGAADRTRTHVTRQAVRPCRIDLATVSGPPTRKSLGRAGWFAPFCSRTLIIPRVPRRKTSSRRPTSGVSASRLTTPGSERCSWSRSRGYLSGTPRLAGVTSSGPTRRRPLSRAGGGVTQNLPQQSAGQSIALPGSDLFEEVRRKLVDDLGMVQVDRRGQSASTGPAPNSSPKPSPPRRSSWSWTGCRPPGAAASRPSATTSTTSAASGAPTRRSWGTSGSRSGSSRPTTSGPGASAWKAAAPRPPRSPATSTRSPRSTPTPPRRSTSPGTPSPKTTGPRSTRATPPAAPPSWKSTRSRPSQRAAENEFDALVVLLLYTLAGRVTEMVAADVTKTGSNADAAPTSTSPARNTRSASSRCPSPSPNSSTPTPPAAPKECLCCSTPMAIGSTGTTSPGSSPASAGRPASSPARPSTSPEARLRRCKVCRKLTPHVLRASRITHMLDAGVPRRSPGVRRPRQPRHHGRLLEPAQQGPSATQPTSTHACSAVPKRLFGILAPDSDYAQLGHRATKLTSGLTRRVRTSDCERTLGSAGLRRDPPLDADAVRPRQPIVAAR